MGFWGDTKDFLFGKKFDPSPYQTESSLGAQTREGLSGLSALRRPVEQASTADAWRGQQQALANQYQGIASGSQMGSGEMAAQRAGQRGLAALASQAASARGFGAQGARAAAARQQALLGGEIAGQASMAGMADQERAMTGLGGLLGQARGQDQTVNLANLDARIRQASMEDQRRLEALRGLQGQDQWQRQLQYQAEMGATSPGLAGTLLQAAPQIAAAKMGAR